MEIIIIDNVNYILGDYILANAPIYSHSCRSSRDIIRNKKIESSLFIYARKINETWMPNDGKSAKFDKVLINSEFIKTIPELNIKSETKDVVINDDNGIEKAPDIIHLNDNEKFKDNDGNILEIETRGVREYNKIYFKVKDIEISFSMENLIIIITDKRKIDGYCENIHYKYFICKKSGSGINSTCKKHKKELFLTYEGLLRVLFVSRNNKTIHFIKWATETLFTCQMGTIEHKEALSTNLLGVSIKAVKQVFNKNISTIPCIYLLNLNTVEKLRDTFKIPNNFSNNFLVCKFGCTKDIETRVKEHQNTYGKLNNVDLNLLMFAYIDPQFVYEAETSIKDYLNQYCYKYETYNELIIINPKNLKQVKNQYDMIQNKFSGHIKELLLQMKELENKLILNEEKYKNEINEYKLKINDEKHKNDILILQHKNEIQSKNIEVLEYKLKILEK